MKNNIEISEGELTILVRKMKRGDKPDILTIEQDSFENPWRESDFNCVFGLQADCVCMVAEYDEQVVGFMVYERRLGKLRLHNIAVADVFHRRGVGTHLIDELIAELSPDGLRSIVAIVRETNDSAIAFFRKLGFHGMKVLREHYDDSNEDAYRLEWKLRAHREIENAQATALDSSEEVDDAG